MGRKANTRTRSSSNGRSAQAERRRRGDTSALQDEPSGETVAPILARLKDGRAEIEETIAAQLTAAVDCSAGAEETSQDEWIRRAAIDAAISYGIEAIAPTQRLPLQIPPAVTAHAGHAARIDVGLGALLRGYMTGRERLVDHFEHAAAEVGILHSASLWRHLRRRMEAALLELTAVVERAYVEERRRMRGHTAEQRRAAVVRKLVAGEPVAPSDMAALGYEVHGRWHIGVVAAGRGARALARRLQAAPDLAVLVTAGSERSWWIWLGRCEAPDPREPARLLADARGAEVVLARGEPRHGIAGWRQTHREARAALPLALSRRGECVAYSDRPLLAAAVHDETLAAWLRSLVAPLREYGDGGGKLLRTLRAYIDSECCSSAATKASGAGRHTVEGRVRTAERLLGRALRTCLAELDVALRLAELDRASARPVL
jgi:hypothetical protein